MKVRVSEKELLNPGYRRVYTTPSQSEEGILRSGESRLHDLKKGQRVRPRRVRARYQTMSEAGLISSMQAGGIGRPATYAIIIDTLLKRQYVHREANGALVVSKRGREVLEFLLKEYPDLFSLEFTARMEKQLDEVAGGKRGSYEKVLNAFWDLIG